VAQSGTERLYYEDSYLTIFSASVVSRSEDGRRVYLDRTAFYPSSGGQPNDLGTLSGRAVTDVVDEDHRVAHVLEEPLLEDRVEGEIDWARRYDHMQQHTGQHVLSAVFVHLFDFPTLSFHMGEEVSTIEIGAQDLPPEQIWQAETRANEIVRQALPVTMSLEEAHSVEGLRKPSKREGLLRIIEIEGIDRSACGGTHVRTTAEAGPIFIRKIEKIRGNLRLEFLCGIRALDRAKQDYRVVAELARSAATQIDALPAYVTGLRARLTETEKTCRRLELSVANHEGENLYAATEPSADGLRRITLTVTEMDDRARAKAQACISKPRAVVLIADDSETSILLACSTDSGFDAGGILRSRLEEAGGRGGGSRTIAQGKTPQPGLRKVLQHDLGFTS
jgi:alanyl-tRNA synthetase